MSIKSINPYDNQILKEYPEHNPEQTTQIINQGHFEYFEWRKKSFNERSVLMHKCADELLSNKDMLAKTITLEMGKVIKESILEIEKCAKVCRYYADNAEFILENDPLKTESGEAYIHNDPLGLILAVMPWNFPFWQVFRFAAPALMAGNTTILKHASNVPQCALAIEETFRNAGFPKGCFNTLLIDSSKVPQVIDHPFIAAVTLTGSEGAGSAVASVAGKKLKKTVLELGGSDPFIVLSDADTDQAARTGVKSRMINFGQSCIAAKRFIIEENIFDDYVQSFIVHLKSLKRDNPLNGESDYAVLARKDLAEELYQQVKRSIDLGAELLFGEMPSAVKSAYFPPLILTNLKPGMPAFREELFGPVACFYIAKDTNDAIAIANESEFGLGGSVWTEDINKGIYVAERVESGAVYVNKMMSSDPQVPFGGIKKSGYGRELSHLGIKEFVNQKTIWIS